MKYRCEAIICISLASYSMSHVRLLVDGGSVLYKSLEWQKMKKIDVHNISTVIDFTLFRDKKE